MGPFNFSKKLRCLSNFCTKPQIFRTQIIYNTIHTLHKPKKRSTYKRINPKINKKSPNPPKITYMRETITKISNILRYSAWDNAQEELQNLSIKWDSYTVTQVLKTHPPMEKAWLFFNWADKLKAFKHDQFTYTTMLDIFGEARRISSMMYVFDKMSEKGIKIDVVTYTSLLHWISNNGDVDKAVELWKEMKEKGIFPTIVSYTAYMKILFDHNRVNEASEVYKQLIQDGLSPNCHTYTVLMEHLANSGKFSEALEIFNKMQKTGVKPDKATCNIMVEIFCKCEKTQEISEILQYMKENYIVLRYSVYIKAIKTFKKTGENDRLLRKIHLHFSSENSSKNCNIDDTYYLGLIGKFIRNNSFTKVVEIVKKMVSEGKLLGTELSALLIYRLGCVKECDEAFKVFSLLSDKEKNVATYTALISAFFACGNVEKGLEMFENMKRRGIKVVLGTYCVLLNGLEKCGRFKEMEFYMKEKKKMESLCDFRDLLVEEKICNMLFAGNFVV